MQDEIAGIKKYHSLPYFYTFLANHYTPLFIKATLLETLVILRKTKINMLLLEGTHYYLVKKTSRIIDEAYYSSHILDLTQTSHNDCKKIILH